MRKYTLLIAALSTASMMLRRSRRFGPIRALLLGALLEEMVRRLRAQGEAPSPTQPPKWSRVLAMLKPSQLRAPR